MPGPKLVAANDVIDGLADVRAVLDDIAARLARGGKTMTLGPRIPAGERLPTERGARRFISPAARATRLWFVHDVRMDSKRVGDARDALAPN